MNKINGQADTKPRNRAKTGEAISGNEDEIPISPEMAAAGAAILADRYDQHPILATPVARRVFEAMVSAAQRPPSPRR